jgi:hypothetical protein
VPAGRAAVLGGQGFVGPLTYAVSVRSLRRCAKGDAPALTVEELREVRATLRHALCRYRVERATQIPTPTTRRRMLGRIGVAAERLLKAPATALRGGTFVGQRLWANKLLDALQAPDLSTRMILDRHLRKRGHDWAQLNRSLKNAAVSLPPRSSAAETAPPFLLALHALADIEVDGLAPTGARFPDPPLVPLVATLAPLWCQVTGRTAGPITELSARVISGESKRHPFAGWVAEMIGACGMSPPSPGRVGDIVRLSDL